MWIKLSLKRNLIYLLITYVFFILRIIDLIIISKSIKYNDNFIFIFLMALGEIFGGLCITIYLKSSFNKRKIPKYFSVNLIHNKNQLKPSDNNFKIYFLIFFAAFFDFIRSITDIFYLSKNIQISPTLSNRLGFIYTIGCALICKYALNFKIGKHQKFSLISLSICLLITIIIEFLYKNDGTSLINFSIVLIIMLSFMIFINFTNCIERYLVDADFLSPFLIIMIEGIYVFIMSLIYSILSNKNPFEGIIKYYNENKSSNFIFLIITLFLFFILSGAYNVYKIYCNAIYSPIDRSLIDYFFNPLLNIHYFLNKTDFNYNYIYFLLNEILGLIMNFFGCIYNEYIILFCWDLDHDTKDGIITRAFFENDDGDADTTIN